MFNLHLGIARLSPWKNGTFPAATRKRMSWLAHPSSISTCVLLIVLLALLRGCHHTPFEQVQIRAESGNPHWLSIRLHTADQRHEYKASEFFTMVVEYSSAVRGVQG